jgi:ATP synthase protein I
MPDASTTRRPKAAPTFAEQIGAAAARKLGALNLQAALVEPERAEADHGGPDRGVEVRKAPAARPRQSAWAGLGAMEIIGWSAAGPALLGVALGLWLDKRHWSTHSWTPALLLLGMVVGCLNAWRWVSAQHRAMHRKEESRND